MKTRDTGNGGDQARTRTMTLVAKGRDGLVNAAILALRGREVQKWTMSKEDAACDNIRGKDIEIGTWRVGAHGVMTRSSIGLAIEKSDRAEWMT